MQLPSPLPVPLLLLLAASAAVLADEETDSLVSWIRSSGGYVDARQEIRHEIPDDPTSLRGVFATEHIPAGDLLLDLPWDETLISADEILGDKLDQCGTARALRREMEREETGEFGGSKFGPYCRLLLEQRAKVGIPNAWSRQGLALLDKVVGPNLTPRDNLRHLYWWSNVCGGDPETDRLGADAALIQVARAVSVSGNGSQRTIMAPYYDLYSHRNGRWHNTRVDANLTKKHFRVLARRAIAKGEQIYNSYGSGTPEMLRDYGFVEQTPQIWSFEIPSDGGGSVPVRFELDEDGQGNLSVSWPNPPAAPGPIASFLRSELDRLGSVWRWAEEHPAEAGDDVPLVESAKVWAYHAALVAALQAALGALPGDQSEL